MNVSNESIEKARNVVGWYTSVATATGAVPVPATSAAIIANNGLMLGHIGSILDAEISWQKVVASFGVAGSLNIAGRTVFVEVAKILGWGTGSAWALAGLCAVGATTAGVQTYIIGLIAIEIGRKGGGVISQDEANEIISKGKDTYKEFLDEMKKKEVSDPGEMEGVQDN